MPQTDVRQLEQPPPSSDAVSGLVAGTTVGMPPTAQTFFAVVNADGSLARGFQAAFSQNLGTGFYEVIFNFDVTGSVYVASIGSSGTSGIEPTGGDHRRRAGRDAQRCLRDHLGQHRGLRQPRVPSRHPLVT